ncbi:unnamed protein product [Chilo suppressalis]|uniref:Uncharacterized protein n=1 Tax=Chilo suppressalis TaxID=168631 RepID=A0ABN8B2H9_CHISP|nr:unnamed protein product [Chilo suppressalis]
MDKMFLGFLVLLLNYLCLCYGKEASDIIGHTIIACHSTDFECFKRQYKALCHDFLLGSPQLGIDEYSPFYLRYGASGTCIRISGFEESELKGISLNNGGRYFKIIVETPFSLHQLMFQNLQSCILPEREFLVMTKHTGPLKKYTGNATIQVTFPFYVKKKKGKTYMILGEEGVDVVLDILDLSSLKEGTNDEKLRYQQSEWAYDVVQHVNVAERFVLPFTGQLRAFCSKVPLEKYLLLYPEEDYTSVYFKYSETTYFDTKDFKDRNKANKSD